MKKEQNQLGEYNNKYTIECSNEYSKDSQLELYIYEKCQWCGEEMTDIRDIWVDTESDNYSCGNCSEKYGLNVVRCREY